MPVKVREYGLMDDELARQRVWNVTGLSRKQDLDDWIEEDVFRSELRPSKESVSATQHFEERPKEIAAP